MSEPSLVPMERIERVILVLRGNRVMLDADLAALYEVDTRALVQAVKRNADRFPGDFMFQLSEGEAEFLRSQTVILEKAGRGRHRKYLPYAFTEQGVAMLSSVLMSNRDGRRAYADRRPLDAPLLPFGTPAAGCDTPHSVA